MSIFRNMVRYLLGRYSEKLINSLRNRLISDFVNYFTQERFHGKTSDITEISEIIFGSWIDCMLKEGKIVNQKLIKAVTGSMATHELTTEKGPVGLAQFKKSKEFIDGDIWRIFILYGSWYLRYRPCVLMSNSENNHFTACLYIIDTYKLKY